MSARILNCTEAEYFADPCETPSLSQSIAKILVSESPRHAWLAHPRLGKRPQEESTDALDAGKIIHALLLGKGVEVELINAPDFRKKAAQEARDEAIKAGKTPMLTHLYEELEIAAAHLRDQLAVAGYEFEGESEVAIEWNEAGPDGPVVCRGRLDHVFLDRGVIYDVKRSRNVNPRYIERKFYELGYDIQHAAYPRAVAALRPELIGRVKFVFLFVETEPPYSVVPIVPGGAFREIGAGRWNRAVTLWQHCLKTNSWPGYCDGPVTIEPPTYIALQELGNEQV